MNFTRVQTSVTITNTTNKSPSEKLKKKCNSDEIKINVGNCCLSKWYSIREGDLVKRIGSIVDVATGKAMPCGRLVGSVVHLTLAKYKLWKSENQWKRSWKDKKKQWRDYGKESRFFFESDRSIIDTFQLTFFPPCSNPISRSIWISVLTTSSTCIAFVSHCFHCPQKACYCERLSFQLYWRFFAAWCYRDRHCIRLHMFLHDIYGLSRKPPWGFFSFLLHWIGMNRGMKSHMYAFMTQGELSVQGNEWVLICAYLCHKLVLAAKL